MENVYVWKNKHGGENGRRGLLSLNCTYPSNRVSRINENYIIERESRILIQTCDRSHLLRESCSGMFTQKLSKCWNKIPSLETCSRSRMLYSIISKVAFQVMSLRYFMYLVIFQFPLFPYFRIMLFSLKLQRMIYKWQYLSKAIIS